MAMTNIQEVILWGFFMCGLPLPIVILGHIIVEKLGRLTKDDEELSILYADTSGAPALLPGKSQTGV